MIVVACAGSLLVLFALVQFVANIRVASSRVERVEAIGSFAPGLSGFLLLVLTQVEGSPLRLVICIAALLNLVVGRACFELVLGAFTKREE